MARVVSTAFAVAILAASVMVVAVGCQRVLPPAVGANVVLLSVDSLRCDRLRPWSNDGPAMPHFEALQARGTVLSNAWAVAPWTAPSMVSVMTGLYPPSHGIVVRDDTTSPQIPTFMRLAADAGYRLGNLTFFSEISYFRNLGLPPAEPGLQHSREGEALARFLDRGDGDAPFAVWVHLLEPHLPYGASGYRARKVTIPGSSGLELSQLRAEVPVGSAEFAAGDRQHLLDLYDHDLELLDTSIGQILDVLRTRDLLEETIIVLVGDHGEELLDHGWVGHASTAIHAKLIPEILHVPMVLAGPGLPAGIVSDGLTQQVDLLPTLCRVLQLPTPERLDGARLHLYADDVRSKRRLLFFDSSAGGNLTPSNRRHERLQAVSDATCLLQHHTGLASGVTVEHRELVPGACTPQRLAQLERELARWQQDQASQRMAMLTDGGVEMPDAEAVETMPATVDVLEPAGDAALEWSSSGGQITLEWALPEKLEQPPTVWIEYSTGGGLAALDGVFQSTGTQIVFGPFPQGFWNDVAGHSPFRFRVIAPSVPARSEWTAFEVRPTP